MALSEVSPPQDSGSARDLTPRQRQTFDALLDAALLQVREHGYENLTVRIVASRAGVTHTTAYTYFSSKDQLIAEVFWQHVQELPVVEPDLDAPASLRVADALREHALLYAAEPALARAGLTAMLGTEPEVGRLRDLVGADISHRIKVALGDQADRDLTSALLLTYSGAMLQAGMGYFDFTEVVRLMSKVAGLLDLAT